MAPLSPLTGLFAAQPTPSPTSSVAATPLIRTSTANDLFTVRGDFFISSAPMMNVGDADGEHFDYNFGRKSDWSVVQAGLCGEGTFYRVFKDKLSFRGGICVDWIGLRSGINAGGSKGNALAVAVRLIADWTNAYGTNSVTGPTMIFIGAGGVYFDGYTNAGYTNSISRTAGGGSVFQLGAGLFGFTVTPYNHPVHINFCAMAESVLLPQARTFAPEDGRGDANLPIGLVALGVCPDISFPGRVQPPTETCPSTTESIKNVAASIMALEAEVRSKVEENNTQVTDPKNLALLAKARKILEEREFEKLQSEKARLSRNSTISSSQVVLQSIPESKRVAKNFADTYNFEIRSFSKLPIPFEKLQKGERIPEDCHDQIDLLERLAAYARALEAKKAEIAERQELLEAAGTPEAVGASQAICLEVSPVEEALQDKPLLTLRGVKFQVGRPDYPGRKTDPKKGSDMNRLAAIPPTTLSAAGAPLLPRDLASKQTLKEVFQGNPYPALYKAVRIIKGEEPSPVSTTLSPQELMDGTKTAPILIKAHTDGTGKCIDNVTLSQNRAKAVQDRLIKDGIEPSRLRFEGYGPLEPEESERDESGKQLTGTDLDRAMAINRRVEIVLDIDRMRFEATHPGQSFAPPARDANDLCRNFIPTIVKGKKKGDGKPDTGDKDEKKGIKLGGSGEGGSGS